MVLLGLGCRFLFEVCDLNLRMLPELSPLGREPIPLSR